MSKLPDGREGICFLALPLPLDVVAQLSDAVTDALKRLGYSDVSLLTDGTNLIVAIPPSFEPVEPMCEHGALEFCEQCAGLAVPS